MTGYSWTPHHRPVKTTEDIWCPFCPEQRRSLYICDPHHWGSAPYFEGRLKKSEPASPAQSKAGQ
jgi:hypothetical protein